ncbi:MAG: TonB-dependent receptor [Muribaculaceae bacterium]|nr:TonB-dependent receptor [Muribaculaceae bacterium]
MRKHLFVTLLLTCGLPFGYSFSAYAEPVPQTQSQNVATITGTILDENNEPVIGASVMQKGVKANAVTTNFDGNFVIKVAPGTKLVISYVGYKSEEMAAANGMTVYLQPTTEQLDQLVVVGYGTQKKANLTGAVATVDVARVMDSRPVQDVTKALQGAVPGLTITTGNGGINSDATIRIRGVGTLTNGQASDPLIVVDGVPVDNLNFVDPDDIADISVLKDAASSAVYGARAAFGVVLITTKGANKKDKVSVSYSNNFAWSAPTTMPDFAYAADDVLGSLQAYYRNSGTNKTVVGDMYYADILPYLETWQQQHGGKRYDSYVQLQPYQDENNIGDYRVFDDGSWFRYADWDINKTLYNSAAPSQKHNISLEGTSGKTQYRLSFGYDSKQSLMRYNPEKMHRYMANANISTEITSWLKAGTRLSFTQREYTEPNTPSNFLQYAWRWAPFVSAWGYIPDPTTGEEVPFRNTLSERLLAPTDKTVSRQSRLQAWAQAEIIKGLTLQADFTYDFRTVDTHASWLTQTTWDWGGQAWATYTWPSAGQSRTRAYQTKNDMDRWTTNVFATYAKTFAQDHNLKVMAGFSAEQMRYDNLSAGRYGLVDFNLPEINLTNGSEASDYIVTGGSGHRATAGFFGRVNYDYKGRYLFEANGRYDGSTRFPAHKQWAFFPSFSAGWRFSEEDFFKPVTNWWSNGKLRASYGHLGNENLADNQFISTITLGNKNVNWLNASGTPINGASMPTLVSSTLTWERVITTDVGIDLGFFNNSLNVTFDWYQRDTKDMLAPGMPLPSTLGASSPLENAGNMRTNGWELAVSYNKSFGDWDIWATATIGDARSKVTKWASNEHKTLYSWYYGATGYRFYEGQTFGDIWGFEYDRYFEESDFSGKVLDPETGEWTGAWNYANGVANQDALDFGNFHFGPGDVKFKDLNGDGVINNGDPDMVDENGNKIPVGTMRNHGDLKVIGNALPRYEYGLRIGAAWKGFDIDLFFQGIGKRNMWQVSNFVMPFAQANSGLFTHQLSYNSYIVDDNNQIIGYNVDQSNAYPNLTSGDFAYHSTMRNTCNQGINNWTINDRYLVNMAYLRMKNITVGYTIPASITTKAYIQKARVYFSTENPFFIYNGAGKYGIDPEMEGGVSEGYAGFGRNNAMMKSYSFGLQVTF